MCQKEITEAQEATKEWGLWEVVAGAFLKSQGKHYSIFSFYKHRQDGSTRLWATPVIPKLIYWAFCGLQSRILFCCIICVIFNVVFLLVNLPSSWEAKCSAITNTVSGKSLKLQCNRLQSLLSILNTLALFLSEAGCVHVSNFIFHMCHFSLVTNH